MGFLLLSAVFMLFAACDVPGGNVNANQIPGGNGNNNQTPAAGDFTVGNLAQTEGNVTPVTIAPKTDKSNGTITIYYSGSSPTTYAKSTALPTAAGTYTVTFDVAETAGFNAATGLSAGILAIEGISDPNLLNNVRNDKAALDIETYMDYFYYEILLPGTGASNNTAITWASSDARYPVKTDKMPHRIRITDTTDFIGTLTLTATIKASNGYSETKGFNVRVRDYEFYGYLCAYFTGNSVSEQQVRFAVGTDGRNFTAINSNAPVILSASIADTKCIRDPFVRRGADGQFYMSLTDMDASTNAWDSNRGIILLKSSDLINWSHSRINMRVRYEQEDANWGTILSAWAPEVVYDRHADKYMVTWSSFRSAALEDHIIYWAYANSDFTNLEGLPVQLIDHSTLPRSNGSNRTAEGNTIDGNIAWVNGTYYLFYKNERANAPAVPNNRRIARASSPTLTGPYSSSTASDNIFSADNQNQEGCQSYRLFGTDNYVVVYDRYNQSTPTWGYWVSNNGFTSWQTSNQSLTVNGFFPRHGHIMPITRAEYDRLNAEWGPPTNPTVTTDATLRVHYTFDGTDTATAIANKATGYTGSAYTATGAGGGYSLANTNGMPNFYTGTNTSNTTGNNSTGYISIPSSTTTRNLINQGNYTIAAYVRIETTAAPTGNGWFLWCFTNNAASDATTGQYMFTRAREMRQTYSLSGYGAESSVSHTSFSLTRNTWYHVMYRQVGNIGTIYVNGAPVAVGRHTIANTSLANATAGIWFGRPCFANDNYMQRTRYGDVRIYSGAISESQIAALGIPARVAQLNQ